MMAEITGVHRAWLTRGMAGGRAARREAPRSGHGRRDRVKEIQIRSNGYAKSMEAHCE